MSNAETSLPTDAQTLISGMLRMADVAVVLVAAFIAFWLRNDSFDVPYYYQESVLIGAVLTLNYMHIAKVYQAATLASTTLQLVRAVAAWIGVMLTLIGLAYFVQISDWFSRSWVMMWMLLGIGGFALVRVFVALQRNRLQRQGDLTVRVAVVGAHDLGHAVVRQLRQTRANVEVIGVFDEGPGLPVMVEGAPMLGTVDDLIRLTRTERIDEIVLAMVDRSDTEINDVVAKLREVPINTKLCAHSLRFNLPVRGFTSFAGLPLLHVFERPLRGWGGLLKTLEDRVIGALLLILSLPVLAIVAIAIKIDSPGPVLFRQTRYGFNNNPITVFKFRSMYNRQAEDPSVPQAKRNDPRVTRVGAFIRKSSLDELPQLFNVLRGEMSLVGPRPHAVAHNQQYAAIIDGYLSRHRVKPGITGWAQVNGFRGETTTPEMMRMRVQYDLFYIDNWSLLLDLKILILTGLFGFVHRNAY
jgi:Undecaprenyl-phosphate glucose phosphotransferase